MRVVGTLALNEAYIGVGGTDSSVVPRAMHRPASSNEMEMSPGSLSKFHAPPTSLRASYAIAVMPASTSCERAVIPEDPAPTTRARVGAIVDANGWME